MRWGRIPTLELACVCRVTLDDARSWHECAKYHGLTRGAGNDPALVSERTRADFCPEIATRGTCEQCSNSPQKTNQNGQSVHSSGLRTYKCRFLLRNRSQSNCGQCSNSLRKASKTCQSVHIFGLRAHKGSFCAPRQPRGVMDQGAPRPGDS